MGMGEVFLFLVKRTKQSKSKAKQKQSKAKQSTHAQHTTEYSVFSTTFLPSMSTSPYPLLEAGEFLFVLKNPTHDSDNDRGQCLN